MENRMSTDTNPQAALYAALAKAQGEFQPITKDKEVDMGKYDFSYAQLNTFITATRKALSDNGLSVVQTIAPNPGAANNSGFLTTRLLHKDGGSIESVMALAPTGQDIKAWGANLTYLRRYSYSALLCISADDDPDADDAGSSGKPAVQQARRRTERAAPAPHPQQQAGQHPQQQPNFYPQEQFNENLPAWQAGIDQGRTTPERLIKMISSKAHLTQQQADTILAMRPQEQQQEQQQ